jgi:ribonuclease D
MKKSASHRRKHRQESHHKSHSQAKITPVLQGNPLVPTDEATWLEDEAEFLALCNTLKQNGIFAFDTEFIGEDSYFPNICLIQVATTQCVTLIDPFQIKDIAPLYELIADPAITVLLHSGSQDLKPVTQLLGKPPQTIFDTQLAAGLIGCPWPLSLTKSIEVVLGHHVGGHFTFSQWDERPLTSRQRFYAADDVRYLFAIYENFRTRLEELGRTEWAEEEFSKYTTMDAYAFDLQNVVKRICKNKNPRNIELQRIQAIAKIREEIAIERNLPPRAIIPNDCIFALGKKPVETVQQLISMKGFPKNIASRYGKQILHAIEHAKKLDSVSIRKPDPLEKDTSIRQELDGVWSLFSAWCIGNNLSTGLVVSRPVFTDWYLGIKNNQEIPHSPLSTGWRGEIASQFASMIQGTQALRFTYNEQFHAGVQPLDS